MPVLLFLQSWNLITTDIDECYEGLSGCSQICKNTIGSYSCGCMTGYQLSSDNHTCTDIDECAASNGGCEQSCINTNGSKYCSCQSGYTLTENELNCTGWFVTSYRQGMRFIFLHRYK